MFIIRNLTRLLIPYPFVGLVVPDVPLEETAILRKEALKNNIELVRFSIHFPLHSLRIVNSMLDDFILTFGCDSNTLDMLYDLQVLLTTPTTPMDRMKAIAEASEGFLYLVRLLSFCPLIYFEILAFSHKS